MIIAKNNKICYFFQYHTKKIKIIFIYFYNFIGINMEKEFTYKNSLKINNLLIAHIFKYIFRFTFKAFIYICIFMSVEIFWRFLRFGSDNGFVSVPLWMLLVYIHIAWLDDLLIPFFIKRNISKYIQAFYIMLLINLFEFSFGILFKYVLGIKVWDYSNVTFFGYKANILGIVSLYGIPAWYLVALFLIWFYPRINTMLNYSVFKNNLACGEIKNEIINKN